MVSVIFDGRFVVACLLAIATSIANAASIGVVLDAPIQGYEAIKTSMRPYVMETEVDTTRRKFYFELSGGSSNCDAGTIQDEKFWELCDLAGEVLYLEHELRRFRYPPSAWQPLLREYELLMLGYIIGSWSASTSATIDAENPIPSEYSKRLAVSLNRSRKSVGKFLPEAFVGWDPEQPAFGGGPDYASIKMDPPTGRFYVTGN